jgi:hypothetical protein
VLLCPIVPIHFPESASAIFPSSLRPPRLLVILLWTNRHQPLFLDDFFLSGTLLSSAQFGKKKSLNAIEYRPNQSHGIIVNCSFFYYVIYPLLFVNNFPGFAGNF